jgi:hypothetical protein
MSNTERLTAPAADAASVLDHELRRVFGLDGVISADELRALRLSRALVRETNRIDAEIGVIVSAFRVDGLRSGHFRRKLREYDRDWEPDGPATAKQRAA